MRRQPTGSTRTPRRSPFVTDGVVSAIEQAREFCGDRVTHLFYDVER
jgi:hypothetical protein